MKLIAFPLGLLVLLQSCVIPGQKKMPQVRPGIHRFTISTRGAGDVAFDSQTGQICRTWDWHPVGEKPTADPITGNYPQRSFGEFAPTCLVLYQKYPSGADQSIEVMQEDSK